ncbi:ABC transporter ATP-binding protein [Corynebacterium sp.]|uniref:ATP-binding cassette domain-containing protein n=1 Tax=Corynebacterium sp. TaxID=1720 RepID=UPI0026DAAECC|nr:ABC transporter ATP-binding protein [Corynebacterium sp.]MDO5076461.1 ABC transporter ATP-binding protein [Corynebacterium sp.]
MSLWKLLFELAGPARTTVLAGTVLRVAQGLLLALTYVAAALVVLRIAAGEEVDSGVFRRVLLLCLAALFGQLLCGRFAAKLSWLGSQTAVGTMRVTLLDRIRQVPVAADTTEQYTALLTTTRAVEGFLGESLPRVAQAISLPLVVLIVLISHDPLLALAFGISLVAAIPTAIWSSKRLGELEQERERTQATAAAQLADTVRNHPALEAMAPRSDVQRTFDRAVDAFRSAGITMVHRMLVPSTLTSLVLLLGVPLLMKTVGERSIPNEDYGAAAAVLMLVLTVYQPLLNVIDTAAQWRRCETWLRQAAAALALPQQAEATERVAGIEHATVDVEEVSYDDTIEKVSFHVPAGGMLAVVGIAPNSQRTLLRLVSRLADPTSGTIRIGGVPLADIPAEQRAELISVIDETVHLFPGTVADNIAICAPEADRDDIVQAAKAAQAHEFIEALPDGYDTDVETTFSRSQLQRLMIARAILDDAPIVVMDDTNPPSELGAELPLAKARAALWQHRTVIVATQRARILTAADQVLALGPTGYQCGTHDALLAQDGAYADFWRDLTAADSWVLPPRTSNDA